jgi:hypothetical protein
MTLKVSLEEEKLSIYALGTDANTNNVKILWVVLLYILHVSKNYTLDKVTTLVITGIDEMGASEKCILTLRNLISTLPNLKHVVLIENGLTVNNVYTLFDFFPKSVETLKLDCNNFCEPQSQTTDSTNVSPESKVTHLTNLSNFSTGCVWENKGNSCNGCKTLRKIFVSTKN